MELKDLQITDDLWDFIEANVPNYHEREEVLRQAQLQRHHARGSYFAAQQHPARPLR